MHVLPFATFFLALASTNSAQETDWLWQFVDDEGKGNLELQKQISVGAKEITRFLFEAKGEGEGEGETQAPPTPAPTQPTSSPPTLGPAQPTPSPPSPPTPAAPTSQPTLSPPTPAVAQPTPSPPAPLEIRTELVEAVRAGDKIIQVTNVTGLAAGMSLTISDDINLETRTIVAVTVGSGRRLVGRRLAVGSVTVDRALENSYATAAFVVAVPQQEQTTKAPSTTTVTTTTSDFIDAADRTNPATWIIITLQFAIAWYSRVVA